jgi:A/G-specific adenine glycosylase
LRFSPEHFRKLLLMWYGRHARELPWRESCDPYRVWVSEIMLQQTRVAAVSAHYHEFLRRFPTVEKLARARESSVLAAWSGLGYYRRARMMHAAAKLIASRGAFPASAEELRELPGVGRYTAAAIASIAFGERAAVVDGNVERVLRRVSGRAMASAELWIAAEELLDRDRPGDFNQAMMELGATVCTPRAPACLACPVVELCATRGELSGAVKSARQRKREIHYALDCRDDAVFLVQRARDARLMAGMWELPEVSGPSGAKAPSTGAGKIAALKALRHPKATRSDSSESYFTLKHSITVTDYTVRVWRASAPAAICGEWFAAERLGRVALTGLARKILRKAGVLAAVNHEP